MKPTRPLRRLLSAALFVLAPLGFACSPEPVVTPEAACKGLVTGDLVITEFMNNPGGTDTGNEYVEIYNATAKEISLDGLTLVAAKYDGSKEKTHTIKGAKIATANYMVLGDSTADPLPAYVDYSYGSDLGGLPNESGLIGIRCGTVKIDEVKYSAAGESGKAWILDGKLSAPNSADNDNEANLCIAEEPDANLIFGSPGAPNAACATSVQEGTCVGADGQSRAVVVPVPGDLVITEIMPNPAAVDDTSGEWFEVLAKSTVDLNGLVLTNAGTSKTTLYSAECMRLEQGQYALFVRKSEPDINGGLANVTSAFSINLANSGGAIIISAGETIIDKVTWGSSKSGVSMQLDPSKLDATANDDIASFCDGTDPYGTAASDLGTPGTVNKPCPVPPDPNNCNDNGSSRPIDKPVVGDLVITEFMADPTKVSDSEGEWVEIVATRDLDMNGVKLSGDGSGSTLLSSPDCMHVAANTHMVFVRNLESTTNGGIESPYGLLGISLSNSGADRFLLVEQGETKIDEVRYSADDLVKPGKSAQLSVSAYDPALNDNPANFCEGAAPYGAGDFGTPGQPNGACQ